MRSQQQALVKASEGQLFVGNFRWHSHELSLEQFDTSKSSACRSFQGMSICQAPDESVKGRGQSRWAFNHGCPVFAMKMGLPGMCKRKHIGAEHAAHCASCSMLMSPLLVSCVGGPRGSRFTLDERRGDSKIPPPCNWMQRLCSEFWLDL